MKPSCCLVICIFIVSVAYSQDAIIKAIEVRDTSIVFGEQFYRVYNLEPYVVYQSQYQSVGSETRPKFDSSTNETSFETTTLWNERRDRFFVFHKDSSFGYQYDPYDSSSDNRRLAVDTAMKRIKGSNNYEKLLSKTPDSTTWNEAKTELREVYVVDCSDTQPRMRIVFYYSAGRNHLKESFNPIIDSVKKMKFYKMELFTEEFYSEADKKLLPPMKLLGSEIREIAMQNSGEVENYIARYKKSIGE